MNPNIIDSGYTLYGECWDKRIMGMIFVDWNLEQWSRTAVVMLHLKM